MFRSHEAIFRQHTLIEPTALCSHVNSTPWCTSSLFSVLVFCECLLSVLRRLCVPLCVPLPWSCVHCTDLVFLAGPLLLCSLYEFGVLCCSPGHVFILLIWCSLSLPWSCVHCTDLVFLVVPLVVCSLCWFAVPYHTSMQQDPEI
jgi:hypothetical protein